MAELQPRKVLQDASTKQSALWIAFAFLTVTRPITTVDLVEI